jgi:hypothetical protein
MAVQMQNVLTAQPFVPPGVPNQDLVPVNQPQGQLILERNPNQDLLLINQALGQLTIEGLRNQEMIIENVTSLFTGLQVLQEVVQSQAGELLLVKEQLKIAEEQKKETAKIFEAYKKASNETMQAQTGRIIQLESKFTQFEKKFTDSQKRYEHHVHQYPPVPEQENQNQTSGPQAPSPNCVIS